MLLSEARTRVARMVDDAANTRFTATTDGDIDTALRTAQQEAWAIAAGAAPSHYGVEGTLSSSSAGVLDLSSINPLKILALYTYSSGQRLNVLPVHRLEAPTNATAAVACAIAYVPRCTFPASAATAFTWGHANVDDTGVLDAFMCALAATELLITEAKTNPVLEARKAELRDTLLSKSAQNSWSVLPLDSWMNVADSGLGFIMTAPDQAQLVIV